MIENIVVKKKVEKIVYFVYGVILATLVTLFVFYEFFYHTKVTSVAQEVITRDVMIEKKDKIIEDVTKRLNVLNDYVEQFKLKDMKDKIAQQEDSIKKYEMENKAYLAKIDEVKAEMKNAIDQMNAKLEESQVNFNNMQAKFVEEVNKYKGVVREKEDEFKSFKEHTIYIDLKKKYEYKNKDISSLLIRMKLLKGLCDYSANDMEFKEFFYKEIFKELKKTMENNRYIDQLKPLKLFVKPPLMEELKTKYLSSSPNQSSQQLIVNSNSEISRQMGEIIEFIDTVEIVVKK